MPRARRAYATRRSSVHPAVGRRGGGIDPRRLDEAERDGDVFCGSDRLAASPPQQVAQRVGQRRLVFDNEHPDAVRCVAAAGRCARMLGRSATLSPAFASGRPLTAKSDESRRSAKGRQAGRIPRLPSGSVRANPVARRYFTCNRSQFQVMVATQTVGVSPDGHKSTCAADRLGALPPSHKGKARETWRSSIEARFVCDGRYATSIRSTLSGGAVAGIIEIEDVDRRHESTARPLTLDLARLSAAGPSVPESPDSPKRSAK